jgi:hypothetical protein
MQTLPPPTFRVEELQFVIVIVIEIHTKKVIKTWSQS